MHKSQLTAMLILMTVSPVAFAQTVQNPTTVAPMEPVASGTPKKSPDLQQQLTSDFQKAGLTDVRVMPDSFLVEAKDKSGNAITMLINPGLRAEFKASDTKLEALPKSAAAMFTSVPSTDHLTSSVLGLDVYNTKNQDIGTINDFALDASGLKAYIIGVGGFLGLGEHYVAVMPSAIELTYSEADKRWHAIMNTDADQLKAAPEYKYPSNL